MKISFDFDSTLSRPDIEQIARDLINSGHDVHITTSRHNVWKWGGINTTFNDDLYDVAAELNLSAENIHFTNMEPKVDFLEGFDMHFDDDEVEIDLINRSKLPCLGILVNYKSYKINK